MRRTKSLFACFATSTQRNYPNGRITLTKFALTASEVIYDSEVRFVSEVLPDGKVGKLYFT